MKPIPQDSPETDYINCWTIINIAYKPALREYGSYTIGYQYPIFRTKQEVIEFKSRVDERNGKNRCLKIVRCTVSFARL